jgi:hypothetical protein
MPGMLMSNRAMSGTHAVAVRNGVIPSRTNCTAYSAQRTLHLSLPHLGGNHGDDTVPFI